MRNRPYPWNDQVPLPEDFPAFFAFIEQAYGERNAFAYEREKERVEVSFAQFVTDVYALAASFRAADRQGQRYALLSENRYEWILFFFAGILAGGVAVPIDKDLPPEEIQTRLTQVQAQILVYSPEYADIAENLAVPQKINMKQLPELLALGAQAGFSRDALVPDPDAAAVIFFTSGTTGKSKGAMYSSGSLLFVAWAGISTCWEEGITPLLILPMHHIFAITLGLLVPLIGGCCNVLCSGPRRIKYFLDNYPISGMFIVPLMAETLAAEIWREAKRQKRTAILKALLLLSNTLYRLGLDVRRVLLRSVRKNFGGRLKILVSGGGQLSADLHSLFRGLGIALFNGYGITEGGGAVSVGRQHYWRDGSVGVPLRNISVKIADGGEILIYGKNVFLGYYGDPEATAVSFTEEGWFKTGDLGYFDEDGFLFLTGRIKNLIITANGENVSPEGLEEKIIQIPGVKEVLVYQEGNEIIAEIYPDPENPDAAAQIPAAVDELNRKLPLYSQIARTKLRGSEFPKTATMKVKRN